MVHKLILAALLAVASIVAAPEPDEVTHPSPPTKFWPVNNPAPTLIPLPTPSGEGDGCPDCTELPGTVTVPNDWATDGPVPTLIELRRRDEVTHPKSPTKTWSMGPAVPTDGEDGCPVCTELPGVVSTSA